MTCPECGSDDLSIGPYDAVRNHIICDACFYTWLVPKPHPWDAKRAAIEREVARDRYRNDRSDRQRYAY